MIMALETFSLSITQVSAQSYQNGFRFFLECIGVNGMIGGQSLELEIKKPSLSDLIRIQSQKTGALFKSAVLTPLLLKGLSQHDSQYKDAEKYADAFGYAFQIADDLEDESQDLASQSNKNILHHIGKEKAIQMAVAKLTECELAGKFSATNLVLKKLQHP